MKTPICVLTLIACAQEIFSQPSSCIAGTFWDQGQCKDCPAGSFSASGARSCTPCLGGTFSSNLASASCSPCDSGYVSSSGATKCIECQPGRISNAAKDGCVQCSDGTFQSLPGQIECNPCPPNSNCHPTYFSCFPSFGKLGMSCVVCADLGLMQVNGDCVSSVSSSSPQTFALSSKMRNTQTTSHRSPAPTEKVPKPPSDEKGGWPFMTYVIIGGSSLGFLGFILLISWIIYRVRLSRKSHEDDTSYTNLTTGSFTSVQADALTTNQAKNNDFLDVPTSLAPHVQTTSVTIFQDTVPLSMPAYLLIDYASDIKIEHLLGRGGFSEVHQATVLSKELRERSMGNSVAVKVLNTSSGNKKEKETTDDAFNQEVALMTDLMRNDNFVKILGYSNEPQSIVMKIYGLGDFKDLIYAKTPEQQKLAGSWKFSFVLSLLTDLANALEYLHSKDISHNDVKPSNALLDQRSDRLHLVLSDFSFATVRSIAKQGVKEFRFSVADGISIPYASPEALSVGEGLTHFSELRKWPIHARDVYAFGIVCYEATGRRPPYLIPGKDALVSHVLGGNRPDLNIFNNCQQNWKSLLQIAVECWAQDNRPRLGQVLLKFQHLSSNPTPKGKESY